MESLEIRQMRTKILNSFQKEFLAGNLLGDGYLMKTTMGYCLRNHHGLKQKEYIEWKYNLMKNLVNTRPRICDNSCYFRTVSNPVFNEYHKIFYQKTKKIAPENIENLLTPFGIAVWIMDDGSRSGGCVRIHSHNFTYLEHLKFQKVFRDKFGIKCNIHRDKGMFRLWIRSESMSNLLRLTEQYFIPSMLYKLPRNDYSFE